MIDLQFYLGSHHPHWLTVPPEPLTNGIPLFVSHRRLVRRRTLPRAQCRWALDSGGFTELSMYGAWRTTPEEYVAAVRRYDREIPCLEWAAPQDWMCEPPMLAKTGLSVFEHQQRTVASYLRLRDLWFDAEEADWPAELSPMDRDPEFCPIMPVLQGWSGDDYQRCWELYDRAGVDLEAVPLVGLGSVCRRQATAEIEHLIRRLQPLPLHGFGIKTSGLARYGHLLVSADSMAWSYAGRRTLPGCTPTHRNEANCRRYAVAWYERVLTQAAGRHAPARAGADRMTSPPPGGHMDTTTPATPSREHLVLGAVYGDALIRLGRMEARLDELGRLYPGDQGSLVTMATRIARMHAPIAGADGLYCEACTTVWPCLTAREIGERLLPAQRLAGTGWPTDDDEPAPIDAMDGPETFGNDAEFSAHVKSVVDVLRKRLPLVARLPRPRPLDVAPVSLLVTDPEAALADEPTRDLIEWVIRVGRICRVYVQLDIGKLSVETQRRHWELLDRLRDDLDWQRRNGGCGQP